MDNVRLKNEMNSFAAYLKRRLRISRIFGCINSLIGVVFVIFYFVGLTNNWMVLVTIAECMGTCFLQNGNLQGIRTDKTIWITVNIVFAYIMYLLTIFLISYGIASGNIGFNF